MKHIQDSGAMFVKQPQGFATALQNQRIAGMNLMQKQFSLNRATSRSNFLSVIAAWST